MTKISQLPADSAPIANDYVAIVDSANNITKRITMSDLSKIMSSLLNSPGDLKGTAAATAPSGWLICDGSAISRTTYAALFTAIGTNFGTGDGSTTFNIPDFRGRTLVGAGTAVGANGATAHALGQKLGEETHVLTTTEIPSHSHADGYVDFGACKPTFAADPTWATMLLNAGSTPYNRSTANAGSDGPHNNMQPSTVANIIIKT